MASTKAKFEGWSFTFQESAVTSKPAASNSRSGRRGASDSSRLVLKRDADGFEIKGGDTIVVEDPSSSGSRVVVLIKEAKIGTADYITLTGLGFLGVDEVQKPPNGTYEQELFLTSVAVDITVDHVIERAHVLSEENFKRITIDTSNEENTFICRMGYDTYYESYSAVFDIDEIKKGMYANPEEQIQSLRDVVLIPPFKPKKVTTVTPKPKVEPKKEKAKAKTKAKPKPPVRSSRTRTKVSEPPTENANAKRKRRISEVVVEVSDEEDDDSDVVLLGLSSDPEAQNGDEEDEEDEDEEDDDEDDDSSSDSNDSDESENLFNDDDEFRPLGSSQAKHKTRRSGKKVKKEPVRKYHKKQKGPKSIISGKGADVALGAESASNELPCRDEQFQTLYQAIESAIEVESGVCVYVSGTPGTGKTVTVREVVRQLYKRSKADLLTSFDYLEINGMKLLSPQSAYELLWNKISNEKVAASNIQQEIESHFQNHKADKPLIVLLDELDQIASKSTSVLYNFFNWPTLEHSKLIVIAVANTMDLPERTLMNKTSSRLGLQRIQFPGYTHEELIEIIKSRFNILLHDGVELKEDAIQFAARKIASVSGDARRALKICQRAIELAVKQAEDIANDEDTDIVYPIVVQAVHINRAILETTSSPIAQFITDLSFVAKLVLIGILSKKRKSGIAENSLGDVIDEIKQIVSVNAPKDSSQFVVDGKTILDILYDDFIIRPRGFEYVLNELIESGLILQQNKKSDRNSMVKLNIADEEITSVFKNDKGLKYFVELTASDA